MNRLPDHWNVASVLAVIRASRLPPHIVEHLPPAARDAATVVVNADTGRVRFRSTAALVLELLPVTLEQHLRRAGAFLGAAELVQLGTQVADAMAHLFDGGIVHGDVALSNFMVDPKTSRVVVTNFGRALHVGPANADLRDDLSVTLKAPPVAAAAAAATVTADGAGGGGGGGGGGGALPAALRVRQNATHCAPEVVAALRRFDELVPGSDQSVELNLGGQDAFATGVLL